MRIIAGKFRGRRFEPPKGKWPTRPTTDMAREALFNILQHRMDMESARVLDLFAGFGGHSYEWLSRGCADVTAVEQHRGCIRFIRNTLEDLGETEQLQLIQGDVFTFLDSNPKPFDLIFADPPYQLPTLDRLPDIVAERKLLLPEGRFVLEHGPQHTFDSHPNFLEERSYGGTTFSFFG